MKFRQNMENQTDLTELPEHFSHKMADVYNLHVDEFKLSKCFLENEPVDVMLRSEWQSTSRNDFYMLYRWFAAAFSIGSVCMTFNHFMTFYTLSSFFIYLTNWGLLMNMIVGVLGAVMVYKWHFNTDFQESLQETRKMPMAFKIYWALHNIALTTSFVVTIIYWSILYDPTRNTINVRNLVVHVMNSVMMFLDILIVAYPFRLCHVIQPFSFGAIYASFTYIYFLCGGTNPYGKPYIYPVLNWQYPFKAMLTVFFVLTLAVVVHLFLFWVYSIRVFIKRRIWKDEDFITKSYSTTTKILIFVTAGYLLKFLKRQ